MKKVSRIKAAISGSLSNTKRDRKITKANRVIDNAIDNAKDAIEDLKGKTENILSELTKSDDVNNVISRLCDVKNEIEAQEETIKVLEWAKEYINEEIEVEEDEDNK